MGRDYRATRRLKLVAFWQSKLRRASIVRSAWSATRSLPRTRSRGQPVPADGVGERAMFGDEGAYARPGRDRVERLDEAGTDECASAVALAACPSKLVKLHDERGHFG
jgi:hypothetical protein